jgi:hypothetical protein
MQAMVGMWAREYTPSDRIVFLRAGIEIDLSPNEIDPRPSEWEPNEAPMRTLTVTTLFALAALPLIAPGCAASREPARATSTRQPVPATTTTMPSTAPPESAPVPETEGAGDGYAFSDDPLASPSASARMAPAAATTTAPPPARLAEASRPAGSAGTTGAPRHVAPPRKPSSAAELDMEYGGGASGAGSAFKMDVAAAAPPVMRAYPPAASIAAGEWDDNANYHEFQKWLRTESGLPFRAVDVSQRRFLIVRDEAGRAVPGCRVAVSDAGERSVTLTTGPSGRTILFPHAEGLGMGLVTATATCDGSSVTRPVPLDAADGIVDLKLPVERALPPTRTIDVAFILDTTGSMSEEIASVKSTIAKVAAGLGEKDVAVRIGLVEYKDRGDAFVTRVHPFATDVKGFAASVAGISAGGGGDTPESVNEGIHVALTRLEWQDASVGRFAFLIGDAPPHLDYQQDFSYAADMKTASHRGIQIFTIAASGMDVLGQVVWRQIAQYTTAANMFVLRGGAGPQSVGGGDPLSSCGGTQQSYTSGNLDALILAKISGELGAIDADPMRIAGLGEDENTKPCDQRVVMNAPHAKGQ